MADTLVPPMPQQAGERPPTLDERQMEIKRLEAEARLRKADAELQQADTDEKREKAARKQREAMQEWRESVGGMAYEYGLGYGLPAAMAVGGHAYGHGTSNVIDRRMQNRADQLAEATRSASRVRPEDVASGDTAARARASGAVQAAQPHMPKTGARAIPGALARYSAYFLPAAGLAAEGLALRETAEPSDEETFRPRGDIQQAVGTGLIGAGAGVGVEGGRRALFPTEPKGYTGNVARVRAMESALQQQAPATPEQPARAATPGPRAPNPQAATRSALAKIAGTGGNLAIPLAAGAMGYDAATRPSEAAQGGMTPAQQAQGIGAGAAAAGGTYVGMRGAEKAGSALARYAPGLTRAAGGVLAGLGPGMAVADTNQFLAERMTESGGDPLAAAASIPGTVAGHVSDTALQARGDFEDALQQFLTLMGEIKQGSADQIPRRPGPQM